MIRQAKLAGAHIAKFQFGWRCGKDEMNFIDRDRALQLKKWCAYWDIEMMASIITEEAWELVGPLDMKRYKIASRTVIDQPKLCEKILASGKETIISLGMWEEKHFPFSLEKYPHAKYLFCRSKYPTYPSDLYGMPKEFKLDGYYGYSDHMQGIEACLLAIARGAQMIEKHFTLNKTSRVIRDHVLSATPEEFRELTIQGKALANLVQAVSLQAS
ncbi:MAG: N-acetylneuraminate synthase family protein [Deltaproteobacteria bacterium]|nr:N-acetylneuraminate synthase family protein [Deltaproteobacteria bacterium]